MMRGADRLRLRVKFGRRDAHRFGDERRMSFFPLNRKGCTVLIDKIGVSASSLRRDNHNLAPLRFNDPVKLVSGYSYFHHQTTDDIALWVQQRVETTNRELATCDRQRNRR